MARRLKQSSIYNGGGMRGFSVPTRAIESSDSVNLASMIRRKNASIPALEGVGETPTAALKAENTKQAPVSEEEKKATDKKPEPEKPKTMLYVGIAVGLFVLVAVAVLVLKKK